MKCDKCGEDIVDTVIEKPDGEKWCYGCMKASKVKPNKIAKTKDKRVLLARKLARFRNNPLSKVYLEHREKVAYTNGAVLISEMGSVPADAKCKDITFLKGCEFMFPNIKRVIPKEDGIKVTIPEDFYRYAKVMSRGAFPRVLMQTDCLFMEDREDESTLNYREFSSELEATVAFNARYLLALKPKEMTIRGDKAASIESSYDVTVDSFKHVLVMPMQVD